MSWCQRNLREGLAASTCFVLLGVAMAGCSWFKAHEAMFPTPADIACVSADVESGVTDPAQVVKDCPHLAVLAVEDLVALIEGETKAKKVRMAKAAAK